MHSGACSFRGRSLASFLWTALCAASLLASYLYPAPTVNPPGSANLPARGAPPVFGGSVAEAAGPEAPPAPPPAELGALRFSPEVDADGDPSTNPTAFSPVPVHRIGGRGGQPLLYASVALAAEVVPDDSWRNPAGTVVTFRLWNPESGVEIEREARTDAWGAAYVEIVLDDLHLGGRYHASLSAPGYQASPARTFVVDPHVYASDTQVGGCRLAAYVEPDGRMVAQIEADLPIDPGVDAASLLTVRLVPTAGAPDGLARELLPALVARRVDDRHARVEIYLDPGDYVLVANAQSGKVAMQSGPVQLTVPEAPPPPILRVEQIAAPDQSGEALVHYRTTGGDAALRRRVLAELPAETRQPAPEEPAAWPSVQTVRLGAFRWRTDTFSVTLHTNSDDGLKRVYLDSIQYDPVARCFDLQIESLRPDPFEDRLTVQVLGPNGVVIHQESAPVWVENGANWVEVVALDAAGNLGLCPLHLLIGEPDYGMTWKSARLRRRWATC